MNILFCLKKVSKVFQEPFNVISRVSRGLLESFKEVTLTKVDNVDSRGGQKN